MKDKSLQNARQEWFSEELQSLKLEFPVAEISKKTEYSDSIVSLYLKNKRTISVDFMKAFCKAYGYDFDAINHGIIEKLQKNLKPSKQIPLNNNSESNNSDNVNNNLLTDQEKDLDSPSQLNEGDEMTMKEIKRIADRLSIAVMEDSYTKRDLARTLGRMMDFVAEKHERMEVKSTDK